MFIKHITLLLLVFLFCLALMAGGCVQQAKIEEKPGEKLEKDPYLIVLGIAQDGGVPHAGNKEHRGWSDPKFKRHIVSLGLVDPTTEERWMIDATPDFREQLHMLDTAFPVDEKLGLKGIFLTHAHIGHYTGLMFLGHESMGTHEVPVYAMPRMIEFLSYNGPWDQLVRYKNILLKPLADKTPVTLNDRLAITPFMVPHRQEYSEVIGFRINGPNRSVLYITDIDKWEDWDEQGTHIEDLIAEVDVAFLDGTFYAKGEIPGRDMSTFPHPFITDSMERFRVLPVEEREKIRFIHLNHTNPALNDEREAQKTIKAKGYRVAEEMESVIL